ncbi:acireductone dioxygenase [Corallococcus sp. H22C18031201]|uniref:1,2-dihydroxy-3-keto-5-methylthiopentene dioxygenase n=1 Tax=Citreicoccus inhibens TaxID=2849499 RepID=UPI000E7281AF|nr:acireductone dioxygenase [Citreicoccus inhibens]MBU8895481.1 acireductone dioxygenase [Citreicoccus inhibens]RJS22488.1 acireductone dioxygenase [Corallococcus sp. H22C18031201]
MSSLTIYQESSPKPLGVFTETQDIGRELKSIGVRFRRVDASVALPDGAGQDEVLAAYRSVVDAEKAEHGYNTVDVVRIKPDAPNAAQARQKFLSEHTHTEDESRIMVEGSGCFYLHAADKVFQVVCTRGDLISVPEGMRHWFDMGPQPLFAAIRFFIRPDGWVGNFTGNAIADLFPKYEP